MAENPVSRDPANGCILLFGMPRSGTTWLGKLFDSHPHVLYRHEPDTSRQLDMPRDPLITDAPLYEPELRAFVAALPDMNALRVAGKRPLFSKAYLSGLRRRLLVAGVEIARAGSRIYPNFPVLFHASGSGDRERRVVWKSIQSLGRLGVALETLPQAKGIHILRHPCGYIASVRRGLASSSFTGGQADNQVYGFVEAILDTPLAERLGFDRGYRDYLYRLTPEERLAWQWVLMNERAWEDSSGNARYLSVRYEDVCHDPQGELQKLFDFCDLPMTDQTRAFVAASTASSRTDYYSVFKNPEIAAWRWRDELEPEVIARIMAIVSRSDTGARYADIAVPERLST